MNGRACSLVRASAVRVCTVPVRGLGIAVCFLCGVVRLRTAYRGGMCSNNLHSSLCATIFACVRAVQCWAWTAQAVYLVRVCVHVGDRHVQPERCSLVITSTCMRACTVYGMKSVGGVRSVHECLCLCVRTVLVPLVRYFGMDSLGDAPILRRPAYLGVHAVRVLVWTAWAAYVVYMSACACTLCTVPVQ